MKAAVLKQLGTAPVYDDFEEPVPSNDEILMQVRAVALKNIDKLLAGGNHYASYKEVPVVTGMEGVGLLEDGTRIYGKGQTGTLAETAVISKDGFTPLPNELDWDLAAAIPNAAMGSYLPLKVKGKLQVGDTVLLNGGTGVTGKFGIQLARYYGASTVIVMGHVNGKEKKLKKRGADVLISTRQEDEAIIEQLTDINHKSPINIVIDYLWGHPTELIISSLDGDGGNAPGHATKVIAVGALAGDKFNLSSNSIRSGKTEIIGSGLGSYTGKQFNYFYRQVLPEMFRLAAKGTLHIDLKKESLEDIETVWNKESNGKRIVVEI